MLAVDGSSAASGRSLARVLELCCLCATVADASSGFDCSNFQAQLLGKREIDDHVFQTIFLNKDTSEHLWSRDQIDKSKISASSATVAGS